MTHFDYRFPLSFVFLFELTYFSCNSTSTLYLPYRDRKDHNDNRKHYHRIRIYNYPVDFCIFHAVRRFLLFLQYTRQCRYHIFHLYIL